MATIILFASQCSSYAAAGAHDSAASIRRPSTKSSSMGASLVSRFHGVHLAVAVKPLRTQNLAVAVPKISATAVVNTEVKPYTLPTWAEFELGHSPVYWDTDYGRPPTSGQLLTIYFNPSARLLAS